jgi:hypothetical protein
VVPKGESQISDKGGKRGRKGRAKGGGNRGRAKRDEEVFVDSSYAILVKYRVRGQIVAIGHRRLISPSEFARERGLDLGYVSRHFRALRNAGFLEFVKGIKVRGSTMHMYRSTKRAVFTKVDWAKLGEAVQSEMAPGVVQDLNIAFTEAMETGTFYRHDDVMLFWLSLMLDEVSWPEFIKILAWGIEEVKELAEDTVNRHANGETVGCFPAAFAIAGFELPTESERKRASRQGKPKAAKRKPAKGRGKGKGQKQ